MNFTHSFRPQPIAKGKRATKKVPFVELRDGRIQGVVSSGSDISRVYVCCIGAASGDYSCSTNNNRPCGGLRGAPCKHIVEMIEEAVEEFGQQRLAEFVGLDDQNAPVAAHLLGRKGELAKDNVSVIFSRFLNYLRYCELAAPPGRLSALEWF